MTITTPPDPVCKRGDVVLILFPNSNLTSSKPRPALVVQADGLQTGLARADSVVMTDNLATITETAINRVIGVLPMTDVDTSLRHTLNL